MDNFAELEAKAVQDWSLKRTDEQNQKYQEFKDKVAVAMKNAIANDGPGAIVRFTRTDCHGFLRWLAVDLRKQGYRMTAIFVLLWGQYEISIHKC